MNLKPPSLLALSIAALLALPAHGQDEAFDITRFDVRGNTLLSAEQAQQIVAPYAGPHRVYGDIQKALEALENAYKKAGYSAVLVYAPEQELTGGVVRLQVTEAIVSKVNITGNKHFSNENVRASLPQLKENQAPNARAISENVQLVNDNPAKQVEVTLAAGEEEGKVDANIRVEEQNPQRVFVTVDNTGSGSSGHIRTGIAYQNANLLGGDEVLTAAYTTSPDAPPGVKVDIYSLAFRMPFYGLGDSLDLVYGDSSVNTPSAQATGFGLSGKGNVFAARWNHYLPREGEFSSKLSYGFDWKFFNTRCSIGGVLQPTAPPQPARAVMRALHNAPAEPDLQRPMAGFEL